MIGAEIESEQAAQDLIDALTTLIESYGWQRVIDALLRLAPLTQARGQDA